MSHNAPEPPREPPRAAGASDPWSIVGYLLSGMIFWGGVGWLLDRWLNTDWLVLVGLLVGTAAATYLVYMRLRAAPGAARDGSTGPP